MTDEQKNRLELLRLKPTGELSPVEFWEKATLENLACLELLTRSERRVDAKPS